MGKDRAGGVAAVPGILAHLDLRFCLLSLSAKTLLRPICLPLKWI